MQDKTELFQHESEIAVLSILLNDPNKVFDATVLRPEYFSSTQHQLIYDTIQELSRESLVADYKLVWDRAIKKGVGDAVGGVEYLKRLVNAGYNAGNLSEYVSNILESNVARHLLMIGPKVKNSIDKGENVYGVVDEVSRALSELVNKGTTDSTHSVDSLSTKYIEDIEERMSDPGGRFMTTGFRTVDNFLGGVLPGELWIIAARPAMAKSSTVTCSMMNTAKAGIPSLLFSKEMSWDSLMDRMVSVDSGVPLYDIRMGAIEKGSENHKKVMDSINRLKTLPMFVDTNFNSDINFITSVIRRYHTKHGVKMFYLDYVQLMVERDEASTHELGRISKALKLLALELDIGIVLVSQLNRSVEARNDKHPILSDLRQSGNLEEDADVVVFLYRDEYYYPDSPHRGVLEYLVRKMRNGGIGTIALQFDAKTTKVH